MTALSALALATGLVRQDNEDAAYGATWLFAIADGLSGHTAGMGTTLTALLFSGGHTALTHGGLFRGSPRYPSARSPGATRSANLGVMASGLRDLRAGGR